MDERPSDEAAEVPSERRRIDAVAVAGYAIGVGMVFVATLGVYWHFWRPTDAAWTWGLGSFAIGAGIGGAIAAASSAMRRVRP